MPKMSGARCIAETVSGYGIDHVFYVEAILRRTLVELEKRGVKRILTHGEKAAAYMADGYARAGKRLGLCLAQSVGAANLAAGLQDPYLGRSPVAAFTGRKPPLYQQRNAYQEIEHNRMYEPVTKFHAQVSGPEELPVRLAQAFRAATSGSPGPVHLDFLGYEGDLTDQAEAELAPAVEPACGRVPARRPLPEERDLLAAAGALSKADRPVLVVGRGAVVSGAGPEVKALAERLGVPVATSIDGKEILPEGHPLYVGPMGAYGRPCANRLVAEADLVFFIGCGAGDQVTKNWSLPPAGTPVIQLDIEAAELGRNYPGALGILGDARESLRLLAGVLGKAERKSAGWAERARSLVGAWREAVEPQSRSEQTPIRPERLCREISAALPAEAVVVADTGYSAIWAGSLIRLESGRQSFLRAAGSLGWAFPAALGAKCALPERPVICFSGDGAFWYHLGELETAARWGIATVTVINNNSVLGQSQLGIRRAYREEAGRMEEQYRFRDTDFARLAEDLGAVGIRVERPEQIGPAIRRALAAGRPAVVDVVTEAESHPLLK